MNIGTFEAAVAEQAEDYEPDTFELCGETFTVTAELSPIPFMKFAKAAESGAGTSEMYGLVAMYDFLRDALEEEDWPRFEQTVSKHKVDGETLFGICQAIIEAKSGNPTRPPIDSQDGRTSTGPKSKSRRGASGSQRRTAARVIDADQSPPGMVSVDSLVG